MTAPGAVQHLLEDRSRVEEDGIDTGELLEQEHHEGDDRDLEVCALEELPDRRGGLRRASGVPVRLPNATAAQSS